MSSKEQQTEKTPSSLWRFKGERDPHEGRYDCFRHELHGGNMTDDELANRVFLDNNDIMVLTAAKDRIRWLSRQLEAALVK